MPTGSPMSRQNARTPMIKRDDRIEEGRAEQRRHRVVRHQSVERARTGMDAEQHLPVVQGGEAENERGDAERGDQADDEAVAREQRRSSARGHA